MFQVYFEIIRLVHTKLMEEATKNEKIITIIRKNRNKKLDFKKILNFFLKNEMFLKIFGLI